MGFLLLSLLGCSEYNFKGNTVEETGDTGGPDSADSATPDTFNTAADTADTSDSGTQTDTDLPVVTFRDLLDGCLNLNASRCPENTAEAGTDAACLADVEARNAAIEAAVLTATGFSLEEIKEGKLPLTVFSQYATNSDPDFSEGKVPYASLMIYFGDHEAEIDAWRLAHPIYTGSSWDYSWWAGYTSLDRLECHTWQYENDNGLSMSVSNAFYNAGETSDSYSIYDTPLENHIGVSGNETLTTLSVNSYYIGQNFSSTDANYDITTALSLSYDSSDQIFDLAGLLASEPLVVGVNTFYTSVEYSPI